MLTQVARGVAWLGGIRLLNRCLDFAALIICARILTPADFGTLAVAMTLVLIAEAITELPIAQALIKVTPRHRTHFDTAFTIGLLRAAVLGLGLGLCGLILTVLHSDIGWVVLILFLSIAPMSRGLVSPKLVEFAVVGDFRREFLIEVTGKLVGASVTILLVLNDFGYWSIAAGTVVSPFTASLLSYFVAPYRPRISFYEWRLFKDFLGWAAGAQALNAFNWQMDKLILTWAVSKAELGRYSMAMDLSTIPFQLVVGPLTKPLMAALVSVKSDSQRLIHTVTASTSGLFAITAPILAVLALLAEPLILLSVGPKWIDSAYLLRWLALLSIPSALVASFAPLAYTFGHTRLFFQRNLLELVVKLPSLTIGAYLYGTTGVLCAQALAVCTTTAFGLTAIRRLSGASFRALFSGAWRITAALACMVPVSYTLEPYMEAGSGSGLAVSMLFRGTTLIAVYVVVLYATWAFAGRPNGIEQQLLKKLGALRS